MGDGVEVGWPEHIEPPVQSPLAGPGDLVGHDFARLAVDGHGRLGRVKTPDLARVMRLWASIR